LALGIYFFFKYVTKANCYTVLAKHSAAIMEVRVTTAKSILGGTNFIIIYFLFFIFYFLTRRGVWFRDVNLVTNSNPFVLFIKPCKAHLNYFLFFDKTHIYSNWRFSEHCCAAHAKSK
jgi:hypothetical protein